MRRMSVSVGIPAYNEEANIKILLLSLLSQKGDNFTLEEIIVVSDCSEDNTDSEIKSLANKKINLIRNTKRIGQPLSQNKIIKLFKGDALILLNADVLPTDNKFISQLITPLIKSSKVVLVSPKLIPTKPSNYFEKIINFGVKVKDAMTTSWNHGDNVFKCAGAARAFSKEFAKKIIWPNEIGEDAYTYFYSKKIGKDFIYQPQAKVYYKLPDNFSDHKKQSIRFLNSQTFMAQQFPNEPIKQSYKIPLQIQISSSIKFFLINPVFFCIYSCIYFSIIANPFKSNFANPLYDVSSSSKLLTIND